MNLHKGISNFLKTQLNSQSSPGFHYIVTYFCMASVIEVSDFRGTWQQGWQLRASWGGGSGPYGVTQYRIALNFTDPET